MRLPRRTRKHRCLAHRQHRRAIHIQADACLWRKTGDHADNHQCAQEMQRLSKNYGDKFQGAFWPDLFSY